MIQLPSYVAYTFLYGKHIVSEEELCEMWHDFICHS